MKIAIADDEEEFSRHYAAIIKEYMHDYDCVVDCFSTAYSLLHSPLDYDLFCLDIKMLDMDGMELAGEIRKKCGETPDISFVTSMDSAVYDVFQYNAMGFVRKTFFEEDYPKLLHHFVVRFTMRTKQYMFLSDQGMFAKSNKEIIRAEASGHNLYLYCTDGSYRIRGNITELAAQLSGDYFVQPYKGSLVNCRFIKMIDSRNLLLKTGEIIPVSKYKLTGVRSRFAEYIRYS